MLGEGAHSLDRQAHDVVITPFDSFDNQTACISERREGGMVDMYLRISYFFSQEEHPPLPQPFFLSTGKEPHFLCSFCLPVII